MVDNDAERTEALKRLWLQGVFIFLYACAFFIIGGIGIDVLNKEPGWDTTTWYQLYYGAFAAAGVALLTSVVMLRVHKAATEKRQPEVVIGVKRIGLLLWVSLGGLILCSVFLGNFVKKSGVFKFCRNNTNMTEPLEELICSEDGSTHKGLSTASIGCIIVCFIALTISSYERDPRNEKLVGNKTSVAEKTEVIKRLGFFGLVFFLLSIAFSIIGGIGITTFQQEHEWHSRFSSQIYCGSLVAGVLIFLTSLAFYVLHKAASEKRQKDVIEWINHIRGMLFLSFVSILVYSILVGSFATESGIFNPCNNTTIDVIHEDKELMCVNYNGKFKALSISCIVIIVLYFLAIWDGFIDRDTKQDKLVIVKPPQKQVVPTKQPSNNPATKKPEAKQNQDKNQSKNTTGKETKQTKVENKQPQKVNNPDGSKSTQKQVTPETAKATNSGNTGKPVNKTAQNTPPPAKPSTSSDKKTPVKEATQKTPSLSKPSNSSDQGTPVKKDTQKTASPPKTSNTSDQDTHVDKSKQSIQMCNTEPAQEVSISIIGNVELLKTQNQLLTEQNQLLRQQLYQASGSQQYPRHSELMYQIYGQGNQSNTYLPTPSHPTLVGETFRATPPLTSVEVALPATPHPTSAGQAFTPASHPTLVGETFRSTSYPTVVVESFSQPTEQTLGSEAFQPIRQIPSLTTSIPNAPPPSYDESLAYVSK